MDLSPLLKWVRWPNVNVSGFLQSFIWFSFGHSSSDPSFLDLFKPQRAKVNSTEQRLQKIFTSDVWFLTTVDLILISDVELRNKNGPWGHDCTSIHLLQWSTCMSSLKNSVCFSETRIFRLEPGSQLLPFQRNWGFVTDGISPIANIHHFDCDQTSKLRLGSIVRWSQLCGLLCWSRFASPGRRSQIFSGALHPPCVCGFF